MEKLFFLWIILAVTHNAPAQNVSIGHTAPIAPLDIRGISNSPSIPGTTSTGVVRIGISAFEGIDIGKMSIGPYIGWIQAGFNGTDTDPLTLQPVGGNVGIGTGAISPGATLDVNGTLKLTDGTQGPGKILTSDATGLASWQSLPPPPPPPTSTNAPSVSICCQRWMIKNLDVATYRNGDPIPKVTDAAAWAALTTGAYCYYNNDSITYAATYGKLYNWYAVNDPRGLAPDGWYIPTEFEWQTLVSCLGGEELAGGPLKETGTTHWNPPNSGATNISGFTGLPGGSRHLTGPFNSIGVYLFLWSSTPFDSASASVYAINNLNTVMVRSYFNKHTGCSIRCIKD